MYIIPNLTIITRSVDNCGHDIYFRWEVDALNGMPEYMKVCYKAPLDVYDEIEKEMAEKGTTYRLFFAKEAVSYVYHNAYVVSSILSGDDM